MQTFRCFRDLAPTYLVVERRLSPECRDLLPFCTLTDPHREAPTRLVGDLAWPRAALFAVGQ